MQIRPVMLYMGQNMFIEQILHEMYTFKEGSYTNGNNSKYNDEKKNSKVDISSSK